MTTIETLSNASKVFITAPASLWPDEYLVIKGRSTSPDSKTPGYFFEEANEDKFLSLITENKFFDRQMTTYANSPLSETEDRIRRIAKALDARWEHDLNDLKPFYQNADFIWLYASTGEVPQKRITHVALVRFPNNADSNGDLVYIEGGKHTQPDQFLALRETALKLAGVWYDGMLPPHANTAMWLPYLLDCPLLELIEEPILK